jgi:2-C-methyl-D-erythritol 2,4-cyclodiphosphate synthase
MGTGTRVGVGYDAHRLVAGRRLVLGGVTIPHERGLLGHSDADVAIHATIDALLGAAALGDIGQHYPDTDPAFKGMDSRHLLRDVAKKLAALKLRVVNIDATIIAQAPRMAPYRSRMIENIAADLGLAAAAVNIKATTTEHLGFLGRMEGIAAQAVALVE